MIFSALLVVSPVEAVGGVAGFCVSYPVAYLFWMLTVTR